MAVDTKDKRFSMLNLDGPDLLLPDPNGSFNQGNRQQLLDKYSGILWAGFVPPTGQPVPGTRHRRRSRNRTIYR
jgi:hypothetical protein